MTHGICVFCLIQVQLFCLLIVAVQMIFFFAFTLNLLVILNPIQFCISCRQHIVGYCFLIHCDNMYVLVRLFNPFAFNVIDLVEFIAVIYLFSLSHISFVPPFSFTAFFLHYEYVLLNILLPLMSFSLCTPYPIYFENIVLYMKIWLGISFLSHSAK